ncbi:MAG TPA: GNAT family N-acetyltransferase [Rhodocyclaceae bacterium]|jgi:ribosomal protein S18 acetylase RimI-like enzyme|nr:GNAT family N-acetyltransferase [Betaproteobacteria bacterium]HMV01159.1 GNAT family N-acetyltransferase [Rhodocyclaceae bacterium]HMV21743.1 GNAT family N-acetyltransferase [Rhodocyclaceae bacterium]HMW76228.1 GNAT family N-acetyltransferase [Rhodocyclaceae bacterium]HNE44161.1 GNAT family N-acetyltransferase [Rhodocyclaceae bacterium]
MTPQTLEIRPVTYPDVPAISALAREIWQASYPGIITQEQIDFMLEQRYGNERLYDDLEDLHKWLDQAFYEGRRVGFAFCEIHNGEFKLDKLYVHPEVQRQGVGGLLISHVSERARSLGYPCVILQVNKRNTKAISSYRKYGFEVRSSTVDDIGGGYVMDDYVMEKLL